MNIEKRSSNGICLVSLDTHLLGERKVFLNGEITDDMANEFTKEIMYLMEKDKTEITVYINSLGGSIDAGFQIIDMVNMWKNYITIVCTERAYSMAAIIMCVARKRMAYPNASFMIHDVRVQEVGGTTADISSVSKRMAGMTEKNIHILENNTHMTMEDIREVIKTDFYMTAIEAKENGLIDTILSIESIG